MTYRTTETVERVEPADPVVVPSDQVNVNGGTYVEASPLAPIRRVVGLLFGVLFALLGLRILLLLLGANAGNPIVDGIYSITEPFVAPFRGIFSIDQISPTGNSALDIAAIVAIVGWALVALLITAVLRLPDRR